MARKLDTLLHRTLKRGCGECWKGRRSFYLIPKTNVAWRVCLYLLGTLRGEELLLPRLNDKTKHARERHPLCLPLDGGRARGRRHETPSDVHDSGVIGCTALSYAWRWRSGHLIWVRDGIGGQRRSQSLGGIEGIPHE
ncbi:hypothetical protein E2C01_077150 [Portunus trituberculatus]|uniref:Uncharacterized protein n=1 Tax=Portunus trituberculatus TaxID=210409 RepID=A0A5B7IAM9_PORTR|nr:hypothetical protein [Portunus trituberculatus]